MKKSGLFVKKDSMSAPDTQVALQGVKVEAELLDCAFRVKLIQKFQNTEKVNIEAVYCFPIEESAAVCGFSVETEDRTLTGTVDEKEKAFEDYDQAIEAGNAAYLLEREQDDIFLLNAGNLKPGQVAVITIEYVNTVHLVDGIVRFQLPTTVSPRYIPAGSDPVKSDRISPPYAAKVPYGLNLSVKIPDIGLKKVSSPSHEISLQIDKSGYLVQLAQVSAELNRDFILEIQAEELGTPRCLIGRHTSGDSYAMIRFFPEFDESFQLEQKKSDLIFILDCSGSMQGSSIEQAREALKICLHSLEEGDLFNIIEFGSQFRTYAPESVRYDAGSLKHSLDYITKIRADLGGTELAGVVQFACGLKPHEGYQRDIILLTDGEVYDTESTVQYVSEHHKGARFYTFGIGYGASHNLVNGLARVSGGAVEMIQPGESIQEKVLRQFSRLTQPRLENIAVTAEHGEIEFSGRIPPVYEGDSFTVFAQVNRFQQDTCISLSGSISGQSQTWKCRTEDIGDNSLIGILWAREQIRALEEVLKAPVSNRVSERKQKRIISLSKQFNITSSMTSFIAIEKRSASEKNGNDPEYRRIPVMITKDYGAGLDADPEEADTYMECCMDMKVPSPSPSTRSFSQMISNTCREKSRTRDSSLHFSPSFLILPTGGDIPRKQSGESGGVSEMGRPEQSGGEISWVLELLNSQTAGGDMAGFEVLDRVLAGGLSKIIDRMKTIHPDERVLITVIAVWKLESDMDSRPLSTRAVKKAKKWLFQSIDQELYHKLYDMLPAEAQE